MDTDEEKLATDNIKLAYDIAWKYYKKWNNIISIDDLQSLALFGLVKASKTFKIELGNTFATYAYKIMENEILMYIRSNKKYTDMLYLSTKITDNLELQDMIPSEIDSIEQLEDSLYIDKLYEEINTLCDRYKKVLLYRLQGLTMTEIGNRLGVTQTQISRDYQKAINILRYKFKDWRDV